MLSTTDRMSQPNLSRQLMKILNENWRDIPKFEGYYQVSDLGNVRGCDRFVAHPKGGKLFLKSRVLKSSLNSNGYPFVALSLLGKSKSIPIHKLVALTFLGGRPEGFDINHKDGNKLNSSVDNLEYCTRLENIHHAKALGLNNSIGENHARAKLKDSDIPAIRARLAIGHTQISIAKDYGVNHKAIGCIKSGKNWSHIK